MKLVDEDDSLVFYLPADLRDALELVEPTDSTLCVVCVNDRPAIDVDVDADAPGVRRRITEGSNRQFSISIPPALAKAVGLVDVELEYEITDDRAFRLVVEAP